MSEGVNNFGTAFMAKPYQVAAIPIRLTNAGGIEVLLVTSRETKRWVVPKGWPWRKIKDHDAAAGILDQPINHGEVMETGARAQAQLTALLVELLPALAAERGI